MRLFCNSDPVLFEVGSAREARAWPGLARSRASVENVARRWQLSAKDTAEIMHNVEEQCARP